MLLFRWPIVLKVVRSHEKVTNGEHYVFVTLTNEEGFTVEVAAYKADRVAVLKEIAETGSVSLSQLLKLMPVCLGCQIVVLPGYKEESVQQVDARM